MDSSNERKKPRKRRPTTKIKRGSKITVEKAGKRVGRCKHNLDDRIADLSAPTINLEPLVRSERAPSNRCRVCIRNLPADVKHTEIFALFKDFGPIKEILVRHEQNCLVVALENRTNAERAVTALNGIPYKDIILKVRSYRIPAVKIKNLSRYVTNELLHLGFSIFGKIEECYVLVDKYGNCTGEGIIEFEHKTHANAAVKFCKENCYFLTSSLKPAIVEQYDPICHFDGRPETLVKKTSAYYRERQEGPRVAEPGTFEYEYGCRFMELYKQYSEAITALKSELRYEECKLEAECVKDKYDYETEQLKELIKQRELQKGNIHEMYNVDQWGNQTKTKKPKNTSNLYHEEISHDYIELKSSQDDNDNYVVDDYDYYDENDIQALMANEPASSHAGGDFQSYNQQQPPIKRARY